MKKKLIILFALSVFSMHINAEEGSTGFRNITGFGCHLVDGTCYFNIDGGAVGPDECLSSNVRFNSQNSINGTTWLSLLQIAITTGKRIQLNIVGCYSLQPRYPTFNYGSIEVGS
jgi:hypothetical protein